MSGRGWREMRHDAENDRPDTAPESAVSPPLPRPFCRAQTLFGRASTAPVRLLETYREKRNPTVVVRPEVIWRLSRSFRWVFEMLSTRANHSMLFVSDWDSET